MLKLNGNFMTHYFTKSLLALSLISLAATSASYAAQRTEASSCSTLKATVKSNGTMIRKHKSKNIRFVYHSGYCQQGEVIRWRITQARDGKCSLKMCLDVSPFISQ